VLENDIIDCAPEIPPICGKGAGFICIYVSFLRRLNIFQGNGGVLVIVKGRKESGLHTDMKFLHARSV
jgi:hypothetical protein